MPPVPYAPADGATVPELPDDCPILRVGSTNIPDANFVFSQIPPLLAAPTR